MLARYTSRRSCSNSFMGPLVGSKRGKLHTRRFDLAQPDKGGSKLDEGEEVSCELLESHGDAAKALDALEETLDEVPLFVEVAVELVLLGSRRVRRDHDGASVRYESLTQRACVVRAVAGNVRIRDVTEQFVGALHLMRLTR